jgi:rare lipoprotein A
MLPFSRILRAAAICSPLALAACAGQTPAVTTNVATPAKEPKAGGIYKVGKPYQIEGIWYYPAEDYAYSQEGIASWYGSDFHGKRTANGDRYDMNDLTAAHPTLPMPSIVNVTNLDNGRSVKLTVNDRGPFHSSRIIDVSRRAAQLLGFYEAGTARVRVDIDPQESMNLKNLALVKSPQEMPKVVASPRGNVSSVAIDPVAPPSGAANVVPPAAVKPVAVPPPPKATVAPVSTGIFVQVGAFSEESNARKLEQQLGELGTVHIVPATVNNKKLYRVRLGPVADAATATALVGTIKSYGYSDAKVVRE